MARVLTKKSTVAAKVPLATDLEIGELAVNTADAKLYTKHSDNTVKQLGISTNDSRLTDAREWTASTVTQAEAEAGTATTRRAWTAQRVFQAITAWWAASAMKTKLDGIAAGATANATDAQLRDRSTHTGTQAISTVTGLQTALDNKINTSERGVSGGVATLDEFARIPPSQLPSYVDDVLEYATTAQFPATGEGGKIYIAINQGTQANPTRQYRWTGSAYAEINPSPGTTDALTEGSTNLYFSEHRVRNTVLTGLSLAVSAAVTAADTVLSAVGKLQAQISLRAPLASPALTGNPTAPTTSATDNDTSIATTAFVRAAMALFGVGANTPEWPKTTLNDFTVPTGFYRATSSVTDTPFTDYWGVAIEKAPDGAYVRQSIWCLNNATRIFERVISSGVAVPWREIWHSGNLVKQTSPTDTTAGALMAVGAFGVGGIALGAGVSDLNQLVTPGRWRDDGGAMANRPPGFPFGEVIVGGYLSDYESQTYCTTDGRRAFRARAAGEWGVWREIFHTGNFNPAAKQDKSSLVATATSRTLALADAWNYLRPGTTGAITLTVPTNASVAFGVGTEITVRALGNITLAAASGVTLNAPSGGTLSMTARMTVTLKKVGANEWDVIGQTVAA